MVISGVLNADSVNINKTKRSQCSGITSVKASKTLHVACVVLIKYVKFQTETVSWSYSSVVNTKLYKWLQK